jgi:hypothetical protein
VPLEEALVLAEVGTIDMSAMAPETLGTVTQLWP